MSELKPICSVNGCLGKNAICGNIKCGSNECGSINHSTCEFSSTYQRTITRADIPESLIAEIQAEALESFASKVERGIEVRVSGIIGDCSVSTTDTRYEASGRVIRQEAAKLREQKDEAV